MNRNALAVLAATCLFLTGCESSEEPAPPRDAPVEPRSEAAGEETLRIWVNALATGDGASGCAVTTRKFREYVIEQAVGWKYVPAGASCADAVAATGAARLDEGATLRIERITRTHASKDGHAYFEVQWEESEEGDGAGFGLVWRDGRYLIDRG